MVKNSMQCLFSEDRGALNLHLGAPLMSLSLYEKMLENVVDGVNFVLFLFAAIDSAYHLPDEALDAPLV
jgi:hypothetical protein